MSDLIRVDDLVKKYKQFTLDGVDLALRPGEILGFIGENGSGKSTTLKAICQLINIDGGSIDIFGKKLDDLDRLDKEKLGVVLDENCLPEKFKINQIDKIFKYIFSNRNSSQFATYLRDFEIDTSKKIKELSKGMKAKLNLAIAFSHDAQVLILDEPMNGLDPIARDEVVEMLEEYVSEGDRSVIISSHITSDLEKLSSDIIFIHKGKIIISENKKELLSKFDVVELSEDEFKSFDKSKMVRYKYFDGHYDALVLRGSSKEAKPATLEDIMVYMIRGSVL
jgi:ABC-2 type transport system ATP-binding protein